MTLLDVSSLFFAVIIGIAGSVILIAVCEFVFEIFKSIKGWWK